MFIALKKISISLMKKIDFWTYVASTEFPGRNMGSSPQTNTNFISTSHLHLNIYFHFQEENDKFFLFIVLNICNFFRIKKAMAKVQKVIDIASQLGSMQEFCEFVDTVYAITKCSDPNCLIKIFNSKLKKEMFDENFSMMTVEIFS